MYIKQKRHSVDSLFTFLLLLAFTLFTLMLAGTGAAIYKNSAAHLNENYTSRTAIAYVAEKIRQYDSSGNIFVSEVEGMEALALQSTVNEEAFLTYIYFYDGSLCELFTRKENEPQAAMGTRLVELSSFDFELMDSAAEEPLLFSVTAVSPEGNELSQIIHCRSDRPSL